MSLSMNDVVDLKFAAEWSEDFGDFFYMYWMCLVGALRVGGFEADGQTDAARVVNDWPVARE